MAIFQLLHNVIGKLGKGPLPPATFIGIRTAQDLFQLLSAAEQVIKLFEKIMDPFRCVYGLPSQDIADIVLMHVIELIQMEEFHLILYHSFLF